MFKKLHNSAVRCPVVSSDMDAQQVARRFKGKTAPRCVVLADASGAPVGLHLASAPQTRVNDIVVLDKALSQNAHVSALSAASADQLKSGAVLVFSGRVSGWIPPEALTAWLSKMARAALRKADKEADAVKQAQEQSLLLLANMSHELRTPLNAIIGYADLMREGTFGPVRPTQYGQYVDSIHMSGEHLLNSINAVLNLARVDAGVVELDEHPISLSHLIHQVIEMIQTQADALDVKLVTCISTDFPMVYGDPQLLRQCLLNLLSNAVKFSPSGSKVRVSAARTPRHGVRITVSDKGPGIPDKELGRILQPFKQASHGPGRTGVGTGLGLSLTKAFIELHEGRLHLLSQEGKGTRAILTVPSGRVIDSTAGFQQGFAFVRVDGPQQKQSA